MESPEDQSPRGFSDSKLRPPPLRILRKSHSSDGFRSDNVPASPARRAPIDDTATQIPDQHNTTQAQTTAFVDEHPVPPRRNSLRLAALVSNFGLLDAAHNEEAKCTQPATGKSLQKRDSESSVDTPGPRAKDEPPPPLDQLDVCSSNNGHVFTNEDCTTPLGAPAPKAAESEGDGGSRRSGFHPGYSCGIDGQVAPRRGYESDQKRWRAWYPMPVSERRKLFEQLSETFAGPALTVATGRSSKPVATDPDGLLSTLRASRSRDPIPWDESPTYPSVSRPLANQSEKPSHKAYNEHNPPQQTRIRQKQYSVADLRRAFERQSSSQVWEVISNTGRTSPSTPKRVQPTKTKASEELPAAKCTRRQTPSIGIPSRKYLDATIRRYKGRSLQDSLLGDASKPLGHQIGQSDDHMDFPMAGRTLRAAASDSSTSLPLLLSRTLSTKVYTIRPALMRSFQKDSPTTGINHDTNLLSQRLDIPASPYPQHWGAWKNQMAMKSTPSLPIMVSTTVATSTRRALRRTSSSLSWRARRFTANKSRYQGMENTPTKMGFQDGGSMTLRGALGTAPPEPAESPIRERIHLFEQLGQPTTSISEGRSKSHERNPISLSSASSERLERKPPPSKLGRGARVPRVLSLSGRRSSSIKTRSVEDQELTQPKISRVEGHSLAKSEGPIRQGYFSPTPRKQASFSFKATLRKISRSKPNMASVGDKNSAAAPRIFTTTRTSSSRFLRNPIRWHHGMPDERPGRKAHSVMAQAASLRHRSDLDLPSSSSSILPAPYHTTTTKHDNSPRRGLPYRNSLSKALGKSHKKTAAAVPVLSPAPAHAHDITNPKHPSLRHPASASSHSWGRRAAAAALDIGRRWRARKASSSLPYSQPHAQSDLLLSHPRLPMAASIDVRGGESFKQQRGSSNGGGDSVVIMHRSGRGQSDKSGSGDRSGLGVHVAEGMARMRTMAGQRGAF
ncbi:hypothetical protein VTI74DRAFT_7069 [Chaetomium olivicolor]